METEDLTYLQVLIESAQKYLNHGDLVELTEVNWEFHETLVDLCKSRLVQDVLRRDRQSFQLDTLLMLPERAADSVAEHEAILQPLVQGDLGTAARKMRKNIENARDAMLMHLPRLKTPLRAK